MKCGTCGHSDRKHGAPFSTDATCQADGCECFGFERRLSNMPVQYEQLLTGDPRRLARSEPDAWRAFQKFAVGRCEVYEKEIMTLAWLFFLEGRKGAGNG